MIEISQVGYNIMRAIKFYNEENMYEECKIFDSLHYILICLQELWLSMHTQKLQ